MNKEIDRIQKNPYLDYFRGISALLVMLFHYTYLYGTLYGHLGDYPVIVNRGSFAVLMFFLLSGYLTFKGMPRYRPWAFVRSRFLRLYPTFWFCLIPTMILVAMYLPDRAVSMKDFLLNFTMIPMYLGADFVDGAYWTLSCDVFFYVLIVFACLLKGGGEILCSNNNWMVHPSIGFVGASGHGTNCFSQENKPFPFLSLFHGRRYCGVIGEAMGSK